METGGGWIAVWATVVSGTSVEGIVPVGSVNIVVVCGVGESCPSEAWEAGSTRLGAEACGSVGDKGVAWTLASVVTAAP